MPDAAATSRPLAVRSTARLAYEWLRESIIKGDLKPGERLVEHKLAGQLGIGQPTLREALKDLELEGFVRKVPKRGSYVTKLTQEDFEKIQEVRMSLETVAVRRAATRITDEVLALLEERVDAMEAAAKRFDLVDFHNADVEFHRMLWEVAGNEYLSLALERVAFGLFAFVLLQREPVAVSEFVAAAAQHRDIVNGLRSGDEATACEAFLGATSRFWGTYHQVS